jgi:hypothetical protein
MKISSTHQQFANDLKDQTALEYPERFLGPNWKNVLNFWIYLDTLNDEESELINKRYWASEDLMNLTNLSFKTAEAIIGHENASVAWSVTPSFSSACATCELIGSHNLESFKFLPLFLNM